MGWTTSVHLSHGEFTERAIFRFRQETIQSEGRNNLGNSIRIDNSQSFQKITRLVKTPLQIPSMGNAWSQSYGLLLMHPPCSCPPGRLLVALAPSTQL